MFVSSWIFCIVAGTLLAKLNKSHFFTFTSSKQRFILVAIAEFIKNWCGNRHTCKGRTFIIEIPTTTILKVLSKCTVQSLYTCEAYDMEWNQLSPVTGFSTRDITSTAILAEAGGRGKWAKELITTVGDIWLFCSSEVRPLWARYSFKAA